MQNRQHADAEMTADAEMAARAAGPDLEAASASVVSALMPPTVQLLSAASAASSCADASPFASEPPVCACISVDASSVASHKR